MDDNVTQLIDSLRALSVDQDTQRPDNTLDAMAAAIVDDMALQTALPQIKKILEENSADIKQCDSRIKQFTELKRSYQKYEDSIKRFVIIVLQRLKHKSFSTPDAKAMLMSREVLDVNEEGLLSQYINSQEYQTLQNCLPSWVTLKLSVDKTALKSFVKIDNSILCDHPEWVCTKDSVSVSVR